LWELTRPKYLFLSRSSSVSSDNTDENSNEEARDVRSVFVNPPKREKKRKRRLLVVII